MSSFHPSNLKILIVDDDPLIRSFLKAFCEVNNYEADFATNGKDAMGLIERNDSYHLAIVDFLMPKMHGVEFIKQVRESRKDIPIIAMSAWEDVEKSFIEAGAYLFIEKPFDPYVLEKEINAILNTGMSSLRWCK